ncbi:hypothetical protein [Clostridium sp. FS41]|uniref:hypothetical protein n=1 Tax=Clostridium sp. FS41 TaxID=1609975 RepID=UPI0005D37A00|nr:hypothetical protein [Clostridium sp. FS41]KJJ65432.1 hypothetical protein CLFS41_56960 [Clostridium sp. FS41]
MNELMNQQMKFYAPILTPISQRKVWIIGRSPQMANGIQYLVALIEKDLDENETKKEQTR